MGRAIHKLSDVRVKAEKAAGRHSDGGGLYLNISSNGTRSWLFMWTPKGGKRREMGLGGYPAVSLGKARARAAECRTQIADGKDPIAERDRDMAPVFEKAAEAYVAAHMSEFGNEKHLYQWQMSLSVQRDTKTGELLKTGYCLTLRAKPVDKIETEHVLEALKPIWNTIPETASRLRGRIERILDAERALGHRTGENPARWRGHLDELLTKRTKLKRGHHPAMPFSEVPTFMAELRKRDATAARALEFTILTASRSGEALGSRFDELASDGKLWTVPAERMKMNKEHEIPLCDRARAIVEDMRASATGPYIFPSTDPKRPLSNMAMLMLLRRMGYEQLTVHGFRSSFRDWCGDATSFPREIAEHSLAHKVGDDTEQAYRRATALAKRRRLMDAWGRYCSIKRNDNVLPFNHHGRA